MQWLPSLPCRYPAGCHGTSSDTVLSTDLRHTMRVLVIEDNRDFAQILRHIFEIKGCRVDVASDALSGMEAAKHTHPDIIFCDIGLPGDMDGVDLARALRTDSRLCHIPIIAISGRSYDAEETAAMAAEFNDVLPKPVKFVELSKVLANYSNDRNDPAPDGSAESSLR